ncbi:DJ-1/PfpI family protein [Patescibacteria group bacterium]|nr:DJ-1/PfpI family protein [Patescibacteria group bacterium]
MEIVMIIAPENFRDEEYFHTQQVIEKAGINLKVASTEPIAISGIEKKEVKIDMLIDEIGEDFDGIVFVGGSGAQIYFANEKIMDLTRSYYESGKIVAAICIAPAILGRAGILKGKNVTSWGGITEDLIDFGANHTGEAVTIDGKIITANGPAAAYKFGEAIVGNLKSN